MRNALLAVLLLVWPAATIAGAQDEQQQRQSELVPGQVNFPVSCSGPAQQQFNLAVASLHSFWYEEAEKAFAAVADMDATCAMGYWGLFSAQRQALGREQVGGTKARSPVVYPGTGFCRQGIFTGTGDKPGDIRRSPFGEPLAPPNASECIQFRQPEILQQNAAPLIPTRNGLVTDAESPRFHDEIEGLWTIVQYKQPEMQFQSAVLRRKLAR